MQQIQSKSAVISSRGYHLLALLSLGLAALSSYLPVSSAELLAWDTQTYVIDNQAIHQIDGSSLWWMLTQIYHANWHPLTWLSHALDIQLFGFEAFGHHWVNVVWHAGCAWLLYLYAMLILPRLTAWYQQDNLTELRLASWFAALLFAVHPQHVESVAWVAERKDLLCGFFYLLCLYCYHHYVCQPAPARYALTLLCAAAAVMSKPMAVSLPVVLLLLDLFLYQRLRISFWRTPNWFGVLLEKLPFALLALISIYMTLRGQSASGAISSTDAVAISQRLGVSLTNWVDYLTSTVLPVGLAPFYPFDTSISWIRILLCLGVLGGLFGIAEWYRRRGKSWIMLALCYYSVTLLPVIGIVQIGAIKAADRYAYLPTIPLYLIAAVLLMRLIKGRLDSAQASKPRLLRLAALLIIPAVLGIATFQYSKVWQNDIKLWEFALEKNPDNLFAIIFLAESYYAQDRLHEAMPLYRRAYANRALISSSRRLNIFINRYSDAAYRLGFYQEAEVALHSGVQEQRLWFLDGGEIYYNAALINFKMGKYERVLQLLEFASASGADENQIRSLETQVREMQDRQLDDPGE